jgi:Na+/H+ antiporter
MLPTIQIYVFLFVVIAAVSLAAKRLNLPPAILLVLAGVILALVPGLPRVALAPQFVLLIVLPPIVYSSAVAMSWLEFRRNLRPISLLALGCVVFTTIVVAAVVHALLGIPWAVGFALGAIVSPPDPVAPLSIARRMELPSRLLVILEGEGLANDATALILYRFAIAAVSLGTFSLGHAVGAFALILVGELAWGIAVGWLMLQLRSWVRDTRIEILLSLLTPFLAFWPPEQLGGSGVLATVTAGLYMSWNGLRLISSATRLQGIFFWDFLIYLIEGMVFLITGLEAHALIAGMRDSSVAELAAAAAIVSAVVIVARFIWMFPATYLPRWLIPAVRRADPSPPWRFPFFLAFTGIRGIVSLAAALAIPFTTESGAPFPYRDLILFVTFGVILVTLVGQGLLMPSTVRWLRLSDDGRRERAENRAEEFRARRLAIEAAEASLDALAADRQISDDVVQAFRASHRDRLRLVGFRIGGDDAERRLLEHGDRTEFDMIAAERRLINDLYRDGGLKDEARRRIERELDLREARLTSLRAEE